MGGVSYCELVGPICPSLSNFHSLTVINLEGNFDTSAAPFPELFMDFLNLSVLRLAKTNFQGRFPSGIFQSKTLRVLDLSMNQDLSGCVPKFCNGSSLESLMLDGANFSYENPGSFSNIKYLKTLSLDVNFIPVDNQSSLGVLRSLQHLELSQMNSIRDIGHVFSWIGDLQNLASLELSGNVWMFSQTSLSSFAKLKSLRSLKLMNCNFTRPMLPTFGNLVSLTSLEISGCNFNGPIPSAIGNLTNLKSFNIDGCNFLGPIPSSIGNLVNLISLGINGVYNDIGPIPYEVGNLSNLESLEINVAEFSGPIPYAVGLLKKLTSLRIRMSGFSGSIPNSISNLTRLIVLDLSFNDLNGELPASVFTIPTLQRLYIQSNQISGSIQDINATSSHLVSVDLRRNNLMGNIPVSFFQLTSLAYLDIGWNNLMGSVDLSLFWRLENLVHLGLSNNNLSVMDMDGEGNNPPCTYLPRVTRLELACCNLTRFPCLLAHLNQLSYLDLSCNRISGAIPKWIWPTWDSSLTYLNLSHNMFSIMQLTSYVLPFNRLNALDLSSNQLQGQIPMPSPPAAILDYSNNNFSSVLPNFTLYLGLEFKILKNNISILDLSFNNFSGRIAACLIEDGFISALSLRDNQFEDVLPNNIKDQCLLQTLDLNNNKIEGQLPRTLKCLQLEFLDIGNNRMVGTFPSWLGKLPILRVLVLRSNQFYGPVGGDPPIDDRSGEYFSSLQILDIALNNFSGNLSPEWFKRFYSMMGDLTTSGEIMSDHSSTVYEPYHQEPYIDIVVITYKGIYMTFHKILTTLTSIDLSNNSFDGTIPVSLGRLNLLLLLNMSGNAFTGVIPREFGGMTQLESLDLSKNHLFGDIPEGLTNLTFLGMLNLCDNQLVGTIPRSGQFATFETSSFEGNLGLCGLPLSNPCDIPPAPASAVHGEKSSHVDVILFLFTGLGFGIGFAAAILMRWGRIGEWIVKSARALRT
ncbi:receptor like protein 22-like [Triticum dicoccoides]|uniref:receptor like protein 22-like n=1 Tax=Triticum dicoccoides TaxID=85692 RepID=UPI00188E48E7|nr:receptor like protein 22-like [Triticum dicoccoides]